MGLIDSTLQLFRQFVQPSLYPVFLDAFKGLAVYSRRSAIGFAALIGKRQNVPSIHLVIQRVKAQVRRFLRFVM